MIKQSIITALVVQFVLLEPHYRELIKSRKRRVELGKTRFYGDTKTEEIIRKNNPNALSEWEYDESGELPFGNPKDVLVFYKMEESNYFNRKPFTCAYCLGFWFGLIGALSILFFGSGSSEALFLPFLSAVLAETFNRLFNLLPVTL